MAVLIDFPTFVDIISITKVSSTTARATTNKAHGLAIGDTVGIAGARDDEYTGSFDVTSVPSTTTFEFTVASSAPDSATPNPLISLTYIVGLGTPTTPLSGVVNGKLGIFSCWFKFIEDTENDVFRYIYTTPNDPNDATDIPGLTIGRNFSTILFVFHDTKGNKIGTIQSTSYPTDGDWHHVLASWDFNVGQSHLYIDDVNVQQRSIAPSVEDISYVADEYTAFFNSKDFRQGLNGQSKSYRGSFFEFYLNFDEFLDFSNVANRRFFIDSNGDPVLLGSAGETPTGSSPAIFLDQPFNIVEQNSGAAGDFEKVSETFILDAPTTPATFVLGGILEEDTPTWGIDLEGINLGPFQLVEDTNAVWGGAFDTDPEITTTDSNAAWGGDFDTDPEETTVTSNTSWGGDFDTDPEETTVESSTTWGGSLEANA